MAKKHPKRKNKQGMKFTMTKREARHGLLMMAYLMKWASNEPTGLTPSQTYYAAGIAASKHMDIEAIAEMIADTDMPYEDLAGVSAA